MVAIGTTPRPIAGSIGLLFGGLWAFLGSTGLPHWLQPAVKGIAVLVTVGLIAALWTRRVPVGTSPGLFRRRSYLFAVLLEVLAIYAASFLLARYGLKSYLVQTVGVIVGLHFVGLWKATRLRQFLWIAGCMCCVSALSSFLPDAVNEFNPRDVASGLGNAVVLWIGASRTSRPD